MNAAPSSSSQPATPAARVILYHQTHHAPNDGPPVSLIPLITQNTGITHVIVAAFHLNEGPGNISLNDHPPDHERYTTLWSEVAWLQASGVKVLGMLGGAAKGTFARLDGLDTEHFEAYYAPLRDVIRRHRLDGLDLDIEEDYSLFGVYRLIDRLRADFGSEFLITLAPVATALLVGQPHLSGKEFDYRVLEATRGHEIAWYNTQFYNGWGDASTPFWYETIIATGWKPERVVVGLLTNPANGGSGYVAHPQLDNSLQTIRARHPTFGGVMGWEYFNALPGGAERPWEWAAYISKILTSPLPPPPPPSPQAIQPHDRPAPIPALAAPHPYPAESVKTLQDLGFTPLQAVAALNATNGNVEYAAGLLFQD
ncbi:glycoside hydrolase family 18 protein [Acidomyces richmondensis BFW]|nr:MAG: glycoside hydrolase family 18 protein [Acidomyces sp. 'richmondensis']KYG44665.1 glycoside hydrolase family 18 protein [Acidomyces richmondensis BFW]